MAIKNYKTGEVTYTGRVMHVSTSCERVMSDIYADVTKACVVEEDGSLKWITLSHGFELCSLTLRGEEDVHPYWSQLAGAWSNVKALKNELETADSRMARDITDKRYETQMGLCAIRKGDKLVVTRKYKNNIKGDTGFVFWVGHDRFSGAMRYGFKTEGGETRWISAGSARNAELSNAELVAACDAVEKEIRDQYAARKVCVEKELEVATEVYNFHKNELREFLAIAA